MEPVAKIGRVIAVAGSIETLLSLHGAEGNGLREKTESLRSKLPPEAFDLSRRIGAVRNRIAHEPDTVISDDELAEYEETARALATLIEEMELPPPAVSVPPSVPPDDAAATADDGEPSTPEPAVPPVHRTAVMHLPFHCWSLVPGLHLLFLAAALLGAVWRAGWFLLLLLLTPAGGTGIWYCWQHRPTLPHYWGWSALGVLAAGYLLTVITALIGKKGHPRLWKLALVPGGHLLYLIARILQQLRYVVLLPVLAALSAQAAAVWLVWKNREYAAAAILTAGSILAAWLITWCRRGDKSVR